MIANVVTILGLGFTGQRVARRLLERGVPVAAAVREPGRFRELAGAGLQLVEWSLDGTGTAELLDGLGKGSRVLHSIPSLSAEQTATLHSCIDALVPTRVVYISSTGVYGAQTDVDETTRAEPADERGWQRVREEEWLGKGSWQCLVLRAAAIYGPGRGVHTALREGRVPRGGGGGVVSRIHVDDLAALAEAALFSEAVGAFPVADHSPCTSAEIMDWCALQTGGGKLLPGAREFPVSGRRVNGCAIELSLDVKLRYPTWREGVAACLLAEETAAS